MTLKSRASVDLLQNAFDNLFKSNNTLSKIRDAALADRPLSASSSSLVPGRSLAWKAFLVPIEPLESELNPTLLLHSLRDRRKHYRELLLEKMRAPDGSYEEGFTVPGSLPLPAKRRSEKADLNRNNPLSLHVENPWMEWFAAVELRKTIHQDVERTFPDNDYFRDTEVQTQLTNILFLYSVSNPSIGYRQGMHDLLAPIYLAVDQDSLSEDVALNEPTVQECFSELWVSADAWALFDAVMKGVSRWYEWREPALTSETISTPLSNHVHLNIPNGPVVIKTYIPPIVQDANSIQSDFLRSADPALWKHMQSTGVEPQIYGIRWLRLLFTREFSMPDAMRLWDGLFAIDPSFALVPWICVAMLIRIRNYLLPTDYTGQLTVLLRYPSLTGSTTNHMTLLLRQALALQLSPTPTTGASLVKENQLLLDIPMHAPVLSPGHRVPAVPNDKSGHNRRSSSEKDHGRHSSSHSIGLPEMIARNLMERGESLGINKTLMSAVSELRRNIPDIASSLGRSPSSSYPIVPLTGERLEERPPWEPRSRLEMEHEITSLKSMNKRLGESLTWIVDVLLQDESQVEDLAKLHKQKHEALESLSYVRDILIGNLTEIDEGRLVGEEEMLQRTRVEESKRRARPSDPSLDMPAPVRASASETSRSTRVSTTTISSSSPSPTTNFDSPRLAPWNYTRSGFSGGSHLPATSLPRLPPPVTSTDTRRSAAGAGSSNIRDRVGAPELSKPAQDPLGAVR